MRSFSLNKNFFLRNLSRWSRYSDRETVYLIASELRARFADVYNRPRSVRGKSALPSSSVRPRKISPIAIPYFRNEYNSGIGLFSRTRHIRCGSVRLALLVSLRAILSAYTCVHARVRELVVNPAGRDGPRRQWLTIRWLSVLLAMPGDRYVSSICLRPRRSWSALASASGKGAPIDGIDHG